MNENREIWNKSKKKIEILKFLLKNSQMCDTMYMNYLIDKFMSISYNYYDEIVRRGLFND